MKLQTVVQLNLSCHRDAWADIFVLSYRTLRHASDEVCS